MAKRHPKGIKFILSKGLEKQVKLVDNRMSISGDSYYWYKVDEKLKRYKYLVIHHTVTPANWNCEQIAQIHLKRWGAKAGIGYHFVITSDGIIHYVGDLGTWRAHVKNRNHECIGISLIGDFRFGRKPTSAQYKSAHILCKEFIKNDSRFNLSWGSVKFHKELQATQCPGDVDKNRIIKGTTPAPKPPPVQPVKPDCKKWIEANKSLSRKIKVLEAKIARIEKINEKLATENQAVKMKNDKLEKSNKKLAEELLVSGVENGKLRKEIKAEKEKYLRVVEKFDQDLSDQVVENTLLEEEIVELKKKKDCPTIETELRNCKSQLQEAQKENPLVKALKLLRDFFKGRN